MEQIWFVYIIQSALDNSYYVGHTHDVELRVIHHKAMKRERQIKRMKSRQYIERLIGHAGGRPDVAQQG